MAAVLACGAGAALSHRSAAALWNLRRPWTGRPEVTTPRQRRRRAGVTIHGSPLTSPDVTTLHGIPVTTPARTIVDLADVLTARAVEKALGMAERAGLLTREQITPIHGRHGTAVLNEVLARPHAHGAFTRSQLEDRFVALIREHGLPHPETNRMLHGYEVDAFWPEHRLVVEIDHFFSHGGPKELEADRHRDAALVALGYRVVRITDVELIERPAGVVALLRQLLGARSSVSPAAVRA